MLALRGPVVQCSLCSEWTLYIVFLFVGNQYESGYQGVNISHRNTIEFNINTIEFNVE